MTTASRWPLLNSQVPNNRVSNNRVLTWLNWRWLNRALVELVAAVSVEFEPDVSNSA